ncbi:hypothetical protein N2152v2_010958 [Parachlorella kessleri]
MVVFSTLSPQHVRALLAWRLRHIGNSLLFYQVRKTACVLGVTTGTGFIISRLPSPHPTLIHWSPPCFVTVRLTSLGFSFGRRAISSFTACMTKDVAKQLATRGKVSEAGFDIGFACGAGLQDRAQLVGGSCTGGMIGTVGVNRVSGGLMDLSFAGGSLRVDTARNVAAYGSDRTVSAILEGAVDPPSEMQPLYSAINTIVNHVERPSCPSRVSASLERITAGFDPERRMVLDTGFVIKEQGADPSTHDQRDSAMLSTLSSAAGVEITGPKTLSSGPAELGKLSAGEAQQAQQGGEQEVQQGDGKVAVEQSELERLRAAAKENERLKAELEKLSSAQQ